MTLHTADSLDTMTSTQAPVDVDSLPDPESLFDHPGLAVETTTEPIDAEDFDAAEAWADHVVVGVADDRGVLLYDDGHHGWTAPAFAVDDDEDAVAVARREFETLTGTGLSIDGVLHARQRTFTVADDDNRETTVWNVLLAATPDDRLPDDPESEVADAALAWREDAPDDAPEQVAADVERIATTAGGPCHDPTESLTDPAALADADGVDYQAIEDDSHFEMNREHAGVAAVAVTNDDGALAFAEFDHGPMLPWFPVESDGDFAEGAHTAAEALLGVDIELDDLARVRRKVSTSEDGDRAVAYDVVYAASPAGDGTLPDEVPNCDAETADWYAEVPGGVTDGAMREDARPFLD